VDGLCAGGGSAVGCEVQALRRHEVPAADHQLRRTGGPAHDTDPAAATIQLPASAGQEERAPVYHAACQRFPTQAAAAQVRFPAVPPVATRARGGTERAGKRDGDCRRQTASKISAKRLKVLLRVFNQPASSGLGGLPEKVLLLYRIHTDPRKSWNLKVTFSRPGKSWNQV